jgi:MerR family transcriptional regulator, heat shock protein HspR
MIIGQSVQKLALLFCQLRQYALRKGDHMTKKFWTVAEITHLFQVDEHFISQLEKEQIVCSTYAEKSSDRLFSDDEIEKFRLAKILIEEMDVNLPGVDIILNMRQSMFDMRKQFDDILKDMAGQMRELMKKASGT